MQFRLKRLLAALALGTTALSASAQEADGACKELTVFVAGKIYTMNPGRPTARAVAVCNGRVVSVGDSLEALQPWTSRLPTTVDNRFAGKTVFPGFIDPHQHPFLGSITTSLPMVAVMDTVQAYGPDIRGVKDEAEAFARIRKYESDLKDPTAPLLIWGWDVPAMGRHLTRQDLAGLRRPLARSA